MLSDATKNRIVRILLHALVLLLIYVLQTMVFSRLRLFGIAPLILPLAVVGVALFEGPSWGSGFGLAAGVLSDMAFSDHVVLFTILLTCLGMGIGLLSDYLLSRGFPSFFLCGAATLILIAMAQMFGFFIFLRQSPFALLGAAGMQTLYSLLFTVPTYYLARSLGRRQTKI